MGEITSTDSTLCEKISWQQYFDIFYGAKIFRSSYFSFLFSITMRETEEEDNKRIIISSIKSSSIKSESSRFLQC
jgi:hypothetical protein